MVAISILATLVATTCSMLVASAPTLVERASKPTGSGAWGYVNAPACPGNLIDDGPCGKSGKLGHWYLYYSPARNGTNCLYTINKTGKRKRVVAALEEHLLHTVGDGGLFKSYAGSVRLYEMSGKCVKVYASVDDDVAFNKKGKEIQGVPFHCK